MPVNYTSIGCIFWPSDLLENHDAHEPVSPLTYVDVASWSTAHGWCSSPDVYDNLWQFVMIPKPHTPNHTPPPPPSPRPLYIVGYHRLSKMSWEWDKKNWIGKEKGKEHVVINQCFSSNKSVEESVNLNECIQLVYHQACRHHLILLYPRELLILDLEINQTVGTIPMERTGSPFTQVGQVAVHVFVWKICQGGLIYP